MKILAFIFLAAAIPLSASSTFMGTQTRVPQIITGNVVGAVGPTSGSTITQAGNCTGATGVDVFIYALANTAFTGVTGTYHGVSMTRLWLNDPAAGLAYQACFRLIGPDSGSNNFVATFTGSTINVSAVIIVPIYGVNQTTPEGTIPTPTSDLTGTSGTASITTSSAVDQLVISFVGIGSTATITNGAGQTTVATVNDTAVHYRSSSQPGTASTASTYTFTATSWLEGAQGIKP